MIKLKIPELMKEKNKCHWFNAIWWNFLCHSTPFIEGRGVCYFI